ncbi:MAG: PQQ-binding-like beta-propeller repeat protein [Pirellulaceae bacterium]|nr:PQQ-binding-like beta-propeller repeat protein [Pirellulaceae bacterium]MDP7019752.1 PQQ-binding-like beta-propeller repeat protein [Pirellulaceae bacterium]
MIRTRALTVLILLNFANIGAAQEWTRFRGPNGTGVTTTAFPAQVAPNKFAWKTSLPGIGHSSPTIWGDRVFLLSADPKTAERYVLCLNAESGKEIWRQSFKSESHHLHNRSSYASCSPAVDDQRVYFAWSTPAKTTFMAFTHAGEQVWEKDLGTWTSQHGFGTSPIVYKDLVILSNSQQARQLKPDQRPGKSFMMAFDRKTGEERWRTERVSVNVCYSVPMIYTPAGGKDQLINTCTGNGMFSLDPLTGKENWSVDAFRMRTVSSPIEHEGVLFGSTGSGGGGNYVVAVRPGDKPEIIYEIKRQAPYVPSIVAKDGVAYLWYDKGILTAIDVKTGDVHWQKRMPDRAFSGSPILAGDKVYCISEDGTLISIAAKRKFQLLGETELGEESRSTPAVSGGRMFLRTYGHLICIRSEAS